MLKVILWVAAIFALLVIVYFLGPKEPPAQLNPALPEVSSNLEQLDADVKASEAAIGNIKLDNEARIVWADSANRVKSPYSVVYIHGFGASWAEGSPINIDIAKRYGANLYLARLHDSGIDDPNAFDDLTAENFVEGAKRALAIGKQLGDSVIVIGTSAGGLLTIYLASEHPELKGIVLYSPCIQVATPAMALITGHWGKHLLNRLIGKSSNSADTDSLEIKYWLQGYHTNGLIALQSAIDAIAKPETYKKIKMPVFMGYYYKNDKEQDDVVSVAAMRKMFPLIATPETLKEEVAFPDAGDHVIGSYIRSKDVKGVYKATDEFFRNKLGMTPVGM